MTEDVRDIFTDEALHRPLFEELASHHTREDEWSGPHGFVFGGMFQTNNASLAEEYFAAANELIEAIKAKRMEDYRLGNAALFLYRHSFELLLKAALPAPKRTHDLSSLSESFVSMVKDRYKEDVPQWIINRLKELAAIDPGSVAFRYGEYQPPIGSSRLPLDLEAYVNLAHLQAAMLALNTALVRAIPEIRMARGEIPT